MFRWLCVAALLAGCGAKTDAEVDPAAEREPVPFDAGFDTFPCRWSLAQPTVVARSAERFLWSAGAVHATQDQALVLWNALEGGGGARLMLGDPPTVLATLGEEALPTPNPTVLHGAVVDGTHLWLARHTREVCGLWSMGDAPFWSTHMVFDDADRCWLEPHDPSRVDVTLTRGSEVVLWTQTDLAPPTTRSVPVGETSLARSVHLPPHRWMLFTVEGERLGGTQK